MGCIGWDLPAVPNVISTSEALGTAIGSGATYTTAILSAGNCPTAPAALTCTGYMGGGFNDWFLPSARELNEMYLKIGQGAAPGTNIGGFGDAKYWCSNEVSTSLALYEDFQFGVVTGFNKDNANSVRAARVF